MPQGSVKSSEMPLGACRALPRKTTADRGFRGFANHGTSVSAGPFVLVSPTCRRRLNGLPRSSVLSSPLSRKWLVEVALRRTLLTRESLARLML